MTDDSIRRERDQYAKWNDEARETIIVLENALDRIVQWADAYPLDIFPEPDMLRAAELLRAGGITLDAVSASAMRHVVKGVEGIAREALTQVGVRLEQTTGG